MIDGLVDACGGVWVWMVVLWSMMMMRRRLEQTFEAGLFEELPKRSSFYSETPS